MKTIINFYLLLLSDKDPMLLSEYAGLRLSVIPKRGENVILGSTEYEVFQVEHNLYLENDIHEINIHLLTTLL